MDSPVYLIAVGLNHRTAPLEVREKLSYSPADYPRLLTKLRAQNHVQGCGLLSTCNRTEVYVAATDIDAGYNAILDFLSSSSQMPLNQFRDFLYTHILYDAVRHLFRVASGLDSMVLGETEILGQVREAYRLSSEAKGTNVIINTLFQQAISVGKKVRTMTKIDQNPISVSYIAIELAKQKLGDLAHYNALVIGAGTMSSLTVKYLADNQVKNIEILNRSVDKAEALSKISQAKAYGFEEKEACLKRADLVICCTSAEDYVLTEEDLLPVLADRREKSILLIDIAVPRDVDPTVRDLKGITLFNIDDLQEVIDDNLQARLEAARKAEQIIDKEVDDFFKWLSSLFVVPTIVALKEKGEKIKEKELKRALNRLGRSVTEREKKVIGSLANSIVNQILHAPIINLKAYAQTYEGHLYTQILQNLFDLEVEEEKSPSLESLTPGDWSKKIVLRRRLHR